jgi:predicted O-methyltransferase YrrM
MELHKIIKTMAREADENWGKLYYHVLAGIINREGFTTGAEIGVAYGGHADYMLSNCPGLKKLYCVDPYTPDYNSTDGYSIPEGLSNTHAGKFGIDEYEELYLHALHRLRRFGYRQELIRMSSHEGWAEVFFNHDHQSTPLDFVFIDGRHTFGDVMADIELWSDMVRNGGIIAGHDFNHPSYPGVTRAVEGSFQFINQEDGYVWWSIK